MNKEELVKLGLSEELSDKVMEKYTNMIPKSRFDEINTKKTELENQISNLNKQTTTLEEQLNNMNTKYSELETNYNTFKSNNDIESYKKQIQDLESSIGKTNLNHLIELELVKNGAKNITAVKSLLDMTKITEDNNNLIEQINNLKESESYLFETKQIKGNTPNNTPNVKEDIVTDLSGAISNYYKK